MGMMQALAIGLIGLTITPGLLFYFDVTPKVAVLLAATAVLIVQGAWGGWMREAPRAWTAVLSLTGLSLAVSTVFSKHPGLSLMGTNWREFGLIPQIAVLLFAWIVARNDARYILRGVAVCGVVTGLYGIAQYFGWDPILPAAVYHIGEGAWTIVRPPGTLGYVSYFATWLVVTTFLSLSLAAVETSVAWRLVAQSAAAISCIAMLLTGTRAAMLGLVSGAIVWLWMRGFRVSRRVLAAAGITLVAAAAFYYSPAGWNLRSRARWFAEDTSGGARPALWLDTLRMAAPRLAVGYGSETFTAEFPRYESRKLAAALPDFEHESPHNMFLDALVAQGIPGLVLLCAVCWLGFAAALRVRTPESNWMAAALTAGVISQQFTVFTIPTAVLIYSTVAMLVRVHVNRPHFKENWWPHAAIAAALLFFAVRLAAADRELSLAQHGITARNTPAAASHYARYERWRFSGASADIWYSRSMMELASKLHQPLAQIEAQAQANAAAARAPQTVDDPFNAWYNRAGFDAAHGDASAVERDLRSAISARPNWFKPHWMLAQVLRLEGRQAEAQPEEALAVTLDGGKHPEVIPSKPLQK